MRYQRRDVGRVCYLRDIDVVAGSGGGLSTGVPDGKSRDTVYVCKYWKDARLADGERRGDGPAGGRSSCPGIGG